MANDKVSIVIPVYNMQAHIEQCVDSVLAQTHRNLQVILIDDASSDRTPEILRAYAKADKRVETHIMPKNTGPGKARNFGNDRANGDYLTYVDSDDWLEANHIEQLLSKLQAEKTDICFNEIKLYLEASQTFKDEKLSRQQRKLTLCGHKPYRGSNIIRLGRFKIASWRMLAQTSFIKENNVRFAENILFDDGMFHLLLCNYITRYAYSPKRTYIHRIHAKSTCGSNLRSNKILYDILESLRQTVELLPEKKDELGTANAISYYVHLRQQPRAEQKKMRQYAKDFCRQHNLTFRAPLTTTLRQIKDWFCRVKLSKDKKIIRLCGIYFLARE